MTALLELGAGVGWPDGEAATAARGAADLRAGRLAELLEWFAGVRGSFPPAPPRHVRCLVLGPVTDPVAELADRLDVGVRRLEPPDDPGAAFQLGSTSCDAEIESGAELLVLAAPDGPRDSLAAALAVAIVTGAEPVALLPRGADAVDSEQWITGAVQLRDARRRVAPLRTRPDELLAALGSPVLGAAAGVALRAAGRRTPVVLDGTAVLAAAALCVDSQTRARRWWQLADTSTDPVHARAVEHLGLRPLLDLHTALGDGTAGLLAVALLQAAVATGAAAR